MENHFVDNKTFRYNTSGDLNTANTIIYVLHGYGQLAKYFIQKFSMLNLEGLVIIAPEGMHRFYLEGTSGRVGASWMTKEDRENDIHDNIQWLSNLDEFICRDKKNYTKIVLGFSQGGATAARWFFNSPGRFKHLILWSSVFPPDLDVSIISNPIFKGGHYFVLGNQDQYYTSDQQDEIKTQFRNIGFNVLTFNGKHDIDTVTIKEILNEII